MFASCSPQTSKWCDILKSPVILRVLQIQKGQENLTEQDHCSKTMLNDAMLNDANLNDETKT